MVGLAAGCWICGAMIIDWGGQGLSMVLGYCCFYEKKDEQGAAGEVGTGVVNATAAGADVENS